MTRILKPTYIEYVSLIFVMSYFWFHEIIMVITGMIIAVLLINISFINDLISKTKKMRKNKTERKVKGEPNVNINTNQKSIGKEKTLISLVEMIEESGFIPSLESNLNNDENDDINAA